MDSAPVVDAVRESLDRFYGALMHGDSEGLRSLLTADVFMFSPVADGVFTSADDVIADFDRWVHRLSRRGLRLDLMRESSVIGVSASRAGAWALERLSAAAASDDGHLLCRTEIRFTALITRQDHWRIAAAYWSVPYPTQAVQDHDKHAGRLQPGIEWAGGVTDQAAPIAADLSRALAEPRLLPGLYSTAAAHVTVGSVVDEVFVGEAGKAAWEQFVGYVTDFEPRGPMAGAMVGDDLAWLAGNIDVGSPPTPYRFFYGWTRERAGWRICVSHDAVSRDPLSALR
jgi:ketosteroid isomerase-like protein